MCLIVFRWQANSTQPLQLLSNRDEFYQRPSRAAGYWSDEPHIYGGRDLEQGGTWLAVSTRERLAAVTNFREPQTSASSTTSPLKSRGHIVKEFLTSPLSAQQFAQNLGAAGQDYPGFNALFFDGDALIYHSNRDQQSFQKLPSGIYGLSNHLLDTPWPKVTKIKSRFTQVLSREPILGKQTSDKQIMDLMRDTERAPDSDLPDTGIAQEWESLLSSIFIESPQYGTRTTSWVTLEKGLGFRFNEQNHKAETQPSSELICLA